MRKGKKKWTIAAAVFCVLVVLVAAAFALRGGSSKTYTLEDTLQAYLQADTTVVATVEDRRITARDLKLVQYSYGTKKPLDPAIEQAALAQLAKADGFALSQGEAQKETAYITGCYQKLQLPDTAENAAFCQALLREHLAMCTGAAYKKDLEKQIMQRNFRCPQKKINGEYEAYLATQKAWQDGGKSDNRLYKKLRAQREKIAEDYVAYRMEQLHIKK